MSEETRGVSLWRRDWPVWAGMAALLVGVMLLDRSFAVWRNDPRNHRNAWGVYPVAGGYTGWRGRLEDHRVLWGMASCGAGLLVVSVVLLARLSGDCRD